MRYREINMRYCEIMKFIRYIIFILTNRCIVKCKGCGYNQWVSCDDEGFDCKHCHTPNYSMYICDKCRTMTSYDNYGRVNYERSIRS